MGRAERRRRRRRVRRAVGAAVLVIVLVVVAVAVAVAVSHSRDGGATRVDAAPAATAVAVAPTEPGTAAPTAVPAPTTTTEPDPAQLPQTSDKPTTTSPRFKAGVAALWQAIVDDDPAGAKRFFFPLGAYIQVKAISNPESDWRTRLVAAYDDDIRALHGRLGSRAGAAQLTGIDVPDSQATWVQPGEEYNKGSYWRVYGSVVHYTVDGQAGSFTIASMISWRGEWYVVHLSSIR